MSKSKVIEFVNEMATALSEEFGAYEIEGRVYLQSEFPDGFWRKFAKEVNYLHSVDRAIPRGQTLDFPSPLRKDRESDWR